MTTGPRALDPDLPTKFPAAEDVARQGGDKRAYYLRINRANIPSTQTITWIICPFSACDQFAPAPLEMGIDRIGRQAASSLGWMLQCNMDARPASVPLHLVAINREPSRAWRVQ